MKTLNRRLLIPAIITATLAASPLAWSGDRRADHYGDTPMSSHHQGPGYQGDRMKQRFEEMAERLNLTESQRSQILDTFKKARDERQARFQTMREQDRSMLNQGDPNSEDYKARVDAAAKQASAAARQRVEGRADQYRAIYNVLTADQREAWANMQKERAFFGRPDHSGMHRHGPHDLDDRS